VLVILICVVLALLGQKFVWGDSNTLKTYVKTGVIGFIVGLLLSVVFQAMGCVRAVQWFF